MTSLKRAASLSFLARDLRTKGSWCGDTHLQKAVYVLKDMLEVPVPYDFILYKHGPFSFDLRDELTSFRADGIFALQLQPPPYGPKLVTTPGADRVQRLFPKTLAQYSKHLAFIANTLADQGVSDLEQIATALYVTKHEPKCSSHRTQAQRLHELKPHVSLAEAARAFAEVERIRKNAIKNGLIQAN